MTVELALHLAVRYCCRGRLNNNYYGGPQVSSGNRDGGSVLNSCMIQPPSQFWNSATFDYLNKLVTVSLVITTSIPMEEGKDGIPL